jgi:hypothetical protein
MVPQRPLSPEVRDWLMGGDPAVVWQVEQLLGAPEDRVEATRAKVATEGWGRRLLDARHKGGRWASSAGSLYSPKWTSTFYTLRLLATLGLDGTHPAAVDSCALLFDEGFCDDAGMRPWPGPMTDCCVNAMSVSLGLTFGLARDERVDAVVDWLLARQLHDGGWNCQADDGASGRRVGCRVSSFHSTLSVLEALLAYSHSDGERAGRVQQAAERGRAYFLRHQLYRRETTGEVARASFTRFSFPVRWYFDVLRGLEYFARAGGPVPAALHDALDLLRSRRGKDGRWKNQNRHAGLDHFELERAGQPSRMNTVRALRVLAWADGHQLL